MKIYTKVVIDIESNEVLQEESFEYDGPLAECISLGGGYESSSQRLTKIPIWNKEQNELFKALWEQTMKNYGGEVPRYPGQMFVPETQYESSYLSRQSDLAKQLADIRAMGEQSWQNVSRPSFTPTPETTEQFYRESIKAPMMQEWKDIVEPGMREMFVGPSFHSSARAGMQQKGLENLALTLGAERAKLYYQDEQARRGALESAAMRESQFAPQMAGLLSQAALGGEEFAELFGKERAEYSRAIQEQEAMAGLQRWLMGETVDGVTPAQYNPYVQIMFQILGLQPYAVGTEGESSGFNANVGFLA